MTGSGASTEAAFPWAAILGFGLGRLRLPPTQFWALSLPELAALAGPPVAAPAVTGRADLARLMRQFPDRDATPQECVRDTREEGETHGR
ncbi:putative phage protein (TIGR02216 family) [Hoeflea marina]|uniref:Putative phage protein (TIGR02216 family) n=1 Tax=Hoeflea marina TaxID=274592 RepID=A0A317PN82_9HYPH|nr:phage tail assembly chaperone [Hoeflea marina]PWW02217.1 putative phage protein (TIGR02216 family) [Hoeflea marina]